MNTTHKNRPDWLSVISVFIALLVLIALKPIAGSAQELTSPAGEIIRDVYVIPDALGSPAALLDEQGEIIWRQGYSAYGEPLNQPADPEASGTLDYTGHQADSSGLVYMGARYYDPEIGRFLSMDPASFDPGNVQSFNRYAYANNNPYRYVDPDGELPFLVPLLIFVGKEAAGYVFEEITGLPAPTMKNLGKAAVRQAAKRMSKQRPPSYTKPKSKNCCFVAGTLVKTDGRLKPIETIEIGDLVYAANPETGEHAYKPVTKLYLSEGRALYALQVQSASGEAEILQVTDDHPFWVEGEGWVDAVDLKAGMTLRGIDGVPLEVIELLALGTQADTYNLEVADFHTFFAGESLVLVHNCTKKGPKRAYRSTGRAPGLLTFW